MRKSILVGALLVTPLAAPADDQRLTEAQQAELAQYFGFGPMQVYKIKKNLSQLRIADLDGDGRRDIAVVNSYQNRIELLYQPNPDARRSSGKPADLQRNELPNRGDLRIENVSVAYSVAVMEIAELTGDGRPDIVFFGEPKELVILPGKAEGGFGPPDAVRAPDGNPRGGSLAVGDFNGDNLSDVALLGAELVLVFHQKPGGGLAAPVRIVHNIKQPLMLMRMDLNGDARDDLIISADEDQYGAYVFLQGPTGALGPARRIRIPKLRSMTIAPGDGGDDLYSIESATGHLRHYRWQIDEQRATEQDWPQLLYSYPVRSKSKRRPTAIGDVNGDGRSDVIVLDPDSAQMILFQQGPAGLGPGVAFPGLSKAVDVCIADADGDGRNEVLLASSDEKMIGISQFEDGRLSFPTPMQTAGEPLAVTVGALQAGGKATQLAYVTRIEKKAEIRLPKAEGEFTAIPVEDLRDDVSGLRFADVNQDGRNDLLLFVRFSPLKTYLQTAEGGFEPFAGAQTREGLVSTAAVEAFALVDVTGDGQAELVLAQKNLARALKVENGQWSVVDQYNPEVADAEIAGLAALPGPTLGSPVLALYDKKSRDLVVLRRRADHTYAVSKTMPVGTFDVQAMEPLALGEGAAGALLLADVSTLAVFTPDLNAPTLVEQRSYETNMKDAWLADAVIGDVNHDGVRDVMVIDMRKANIELLTTAPNGELVKAMRFQVFQGKRFRDDPDAGGEPREVLCGDVTGDSIDDVVLIAHDRIIVYPGQ